MQNGGKHCQESCFLKIQYKQLPSQVVFSIQCTKRAVCFLKELNIEFGLFTSKQKHPLDMKWNAFTTPQTSHSKNTYIEMFPQKKKKKKKLRKTEVHWKGSPDRKQKSVNSCLKNIIWIYEHQVPNWFRPVCNLDSPLWPSVTGRRHMCVHSSVQFKIVVGTCRFCPGLEYS